MKNISKTSYILFAVLITLASCKKGSGERPGSEPPLEGQPGQGKVTAKGETIGAKVIKTIGLAGGTLVSDDNSFVLTIPAGALDADAQISIQRITNESPNGLKDGYRILPENLALNKRASMCWKYNAVALHGAKSSELILAYQGKDKVWNGTKDLHVDEKDSTVCFNGLDKLENSDWSFVGTICMKSKHGDSVLRMQSRGLMITSLDIANQYWNPLPNEKIYYSKQISAIFVNGIENGEEDETGSLIANNGSTPDEFSAEFSAPTQKLPAKNPVELKAILETRPGQFKEITSYLFIKKGNNSLTLPGEGVAINPMSFHQLRGKGMRININDRNVVPGKDGVFLTMEMENFDETKNSYVVSKDVHILGWVNKDGARTWSTEYTENGVEKYAVGDIKIHSIKHIMEKGNVQTIISGRYSTYLYAAATAGKYDKILVSGSFEAFGI